MYDLLIKNGMVVFPSGERKADILVKDGKIAALGLNFADDAATSVVDAEGLIVTPGMVDSHCHITDPGGGYRDNWEGYETGTRSAVKGGVTAVVEMPLNQIPCTHDHASFEMKKQASTGRIYLDVASLGALTPFSLNTLNELDQDGVVGFKAFMATCGDRAIDGDMENVDDYTLWEGMRRIAKTGKPLMLHAENAAITDRLGELAKSEGPDNLVEYVKSRPVFTELEAVRRAIFFAKQTGCRIGICHCSCPEVIEEITRARAEGVNVIAESCTHYFYFTTEELDEIGNTSKCSPPLRDKKNLEGMWHQLLAGNIEFIGSDHSPCNPELKDTSALKAWGGIAGLQNCYDVMFDEAVNKHKMPLAQFVALTATNACKFFNIKEKGSIEVGKDADLVLINPEEEYTVRAEDLEYRNKITAYMGRTIGCKVKKTFIRGQEVYDDKAGVNDEAIGKLYFTGGSNS